MKQRSSKRAKALDINQKVKKDVWERDGHRCILCGNQEAMPNAHIIPRSANGMGIEENVVTLCRECHRRYDQSIHRAEMMPDIISYIKQFYPDWEPEKVIYKKYHF